MIHSRCALFGPLVGCARGVCGRIRAAATNQCQFFTTRQKQFPQLEGGRVMIACCMQSTASPFTRAVCIMQSPAIRTQCSKFYWIKFVRHLLYISGTTNDPANVCVVCYLSVLALHCHGYDSGVEIVKLYSPKPKSWCGRRTERSNQCRAKLLSFPSH